VVADFEATKKIAEAYANDVRKALPIDKAVLYGSYATGKATALSDIDICFFMPDFGGKPRVEIIIKLLDLTDNYKGTYFEPTAFTTSEIERGNPFVKEILKTGIDI
jgi:predicted nucleotidyltransferase